MKPTAALICFTQNGAKLAEQLIGQLNEEFDWYGFVSSRTKLDTNLPQKEGSLSDWTGEWFSKVQCLVFVGACGIAVRAIAPFVRDKFADPAVIVIDEQGKFCISLLSGHMGGANEWTARFAEVLGAEPVITTATDLNHKFAVDVFAKKNNLLITDRTLAKEVSAAVVRGEKINFYSHEMPKGKIPPELCWHQDTKEACGVSSGISIHVGVLEKQPNPKELWLVPKNLVLGIGCRKGTPMEQIERFVLEKMEEYHLDFRRVRAVASIDLKKEEKGLIDFCRKYDLAFETYSKEELLLAKGNFVSSDFVKGVTGVDNVCERSAVVFAQEDDSCLIVHKQKGGSVTLAVAQKTATCHF